MDCGFSRNKLRFNMWHQGIVSSLLEFFVDGVCMHILVLQFCIGAIMSA